MNRKRIYNLTLVSALPGLLVLAVLSLFTPWLSEAATDLAGRWEGSVIVTAGPGTGTNLPCEFLISRKGARFTGTATCNGSAPISFSGTGTDNVAGSATDGVTFGGVRNGSAASGTWNSPNDSRSGTWSITRADAQ